MADITKADFADELSQDIFLYRKKFYETGDWRWLLRMSIRSHSDTVAKINRLSDKFYKEIKALKNNIVVFGGGKW